MSWTQVVVLSLLTTLLFLTFSSVVDSAAVRDDSKAGHAKGHPKGPARPVFVPESEASNFFKRRSRRSPRNYAELQAEQRIKMAANERWREYNEEQRNEHENYAEEVRDEPDVYLELEFQFGSGMNFTSPTSFWTAADFVVDPKLTIFPEEQDERSRETNEQLREYHYDGLYPRYHWFH